MAVALAIENMTHTQIANLLFYLALSVAAIYAEVKLPEYAVWVLIVVMAAAYAKSCWNFTVNPDGTSASGSYGSN
jgi:hypothetical protein